MDALGFIFTVGIVVVGGIILWTNTRVARNGWKACKWGEL